MKISRTQEDTMCLVLRLRGGGPLRQKSEFGVAAGGLIKQCIIEDVNAASTWDREQTICFNVQILNSLLFKQVTGMSPPETPVSAATYAAHGLPFFKIYSETSNVNGDFTGVKSVKEIDKEKDDAMDSAASESSEEDSKEDEMEHAYPQPPYRNPLILLNPDGVKTEFRPVSELEKELLSMNSVQF